MDCHSALGQFRRGRLDQSEVLNISLAIQTDTAQRLHGILSAGQQLDGEKGRKGMRDVYRTCIRAHSKCFRDFFQQLLDHGGPHLFRCAAGKDRTGTAGAMLLTASGVEWDAIVADYLLTNVHWKLKEHQGMPPELRRALGAADADYLSAAFQVIDAEFSGWNAYAQNRLDLGDSEHARLRASGIEGAAGVCRLASGGDAAPSGKRMRVVAKEKHLCH